MRSLFLLFSLFFLGLGQIFAQTPPQKVSVQFEWKHQFEFAGFYMAKEKGYYRDLGIDPEFKEFHNGMDIVKEVVDGKSTFGISSSSLILEKLNGKPVVLLASYFKQNVLALAVKKNIKTLQDLKGKKIMAVDWELEHTSIGAMLRDAKINKNDYKFVPHTFGTKEFERGEVDAMTIFSTSQPYILDKKGIEYTIINPATYGMYSYDVELFTTQNLVNSNPKLVRDFIEATKKGWEYALTHKEETINHIYETYSKRKSKDDLMYEAYATDKIFKRDIFAVGSIVPELIKLNTEVYKKLGLMRGDATVLDVMEEYIFDYFRSTNNRLSLTNEEKRYIEKKKVIYLQNETDWAPFNFSHNGLPAGFSVDFIRLVGGKIGLDVAFIGGKPWAEYIEMLKNRKLDGMLNIAKTQEREKHFIFTTPYFNSIDSVFVRKENTHLKRLEDFHGKKLAVVAGFYEEELLRKYHPQIILVPHKTTLDAIKSVVFGRVDGVTDSYSVITYLLKTEGIADLLPSFDIDDKRLSMMLHLATHKNDPVLVGILQKGIDSITQEEILTLKNKWFGELLKDKNTLLFSSSERKYLQEKGKITMCVDPDWIPFETIEDGKHIGMAADFINFFGKTMGVEIELVPTKDWSESMEYAKARRCDILSLAMETPSRKQYMNFSVPYLKVPLVLVTRNSVPFVDSFESIFDKTLSITKGFAFVEVLRSKYPNIKLVEVGNLDEGLSGVRDGKFFGHIDTLVSTSYAFQKGYMGELKVSGKFDESWNLGVAVRNDNIMLLDIFNKVISAMTAEEYQKIFNKWVAIKYESKVDYSLVWKIVFGALFFIVVMLYWVGRLRTLNKELHKAKKLAEDAVNAKSNFLANVSHEVRTPMNAILGMIYILRQTPLSPKQAEYIEKLEGASGTLLKLINDILDFSKLEARKLEILSLPFDIKAMAHEIENIAQVSAKQKGITFAILIENDVPQVLLGDSLRLMQVLLNLVANGIKFTKEGGVQVKITRVSGDLYRFSVIDTGIGIASTHEAKVFESFTQADETTTRNYGGTGLGLSISREFVKMMGGDITVKSQLGLGSQFSFEITLQEATQEVIKELYKAKTTSDSVSQEEISQSDRGESAQKHQKISITFDEKVKLFLELSRALKTKRPALIYDPLSHLQTIWLDDSEEQLIAAIDQFVHSYQYSEASSLLNVWLENNKGAIV